MTPGSTPAPAAPPPDANVVHLLRRVAGELPRRPALAFRDEGPISFGELAARIDRAAGGFAREGLAAGERAVVLVPMSAELYVALLGVLQLGALGVFLDPWVGRAQMAALAELAEPAAFVGIGRAHLLRLTAPALRRAPLQVTAGRRLGPLPAPRTLAEIEGAAPLGRVQPAGPGDSALITFTTGSSGRPKGADRTHGFLVAQHRALRRAFPYRDDDVDLPMFPVFALNNLAQGVPSVVPDMDFRRVGAVDGRRILAQIALRRVTTATASPPFVDRLTEAIGAGPERPPLRRLLTGGAPVSDRRLERWRRALPETEIVVVYGSTEAEPVAHVSAEERLAAAAAADEPPRGYLVGRLVPEVRARLVPIRREPIALGDGGWSGLEVPPGEVGELLVTGDHVGRRYFRSPESTAANKVIEPDGTVWHRMGDTGRFDAEGRFWLVGRVHSTIFRGGETIHPQLVEQAAQGDDPRIARTAAVGLADASKDERLVVVIEPAPGAAASTGAVRAGAAARLRAAGVEPDEVRLAARPLPLDPRHASKVDYDALRRSLR